MYPPEVERFVARHGLAEISHSVGSAFGDLQTCFASDEMDLRITRDRGQWLAEIRPSQGGRWLYLSRLLRYLENYPPISPPNVLPDIGEMMTKADQGYSTIVEVLNDPDKCAKAYEYEQQVSAAFVASLLQ